MIVTRHFEVDTYCKMPRDIIEGTFLEAFIKEDNSWMIENDTLIAFRGTKYSVYKISDNYYVLQNENTNIIAEKIK